MALAQPRTKVSEEAVLDTALTLFAERGYHGTAVSEIASVLGVRTPSLYNHMRSKQDLLRAIVDRTTAAVFEDFFGVLARTDDPVERLREATVGTPGATPVTAEKRSWSTATPTAWKTRIAPACRHDDESTSTPSARSSPTVSRSVPSPSTRRRSRHSPSGRCA